MLRSADTRALARWLAIRIAALPLIFIVVSFASYFLLFGPQHDDPAEIIGGQGITRQQRDDIRAALNLDQPLLERYGRWLGNALRGDFGRGYFSDEPIAQEMRRRMAPTMQILITSFIFAAAIGWLLTIGLSLGHALERSTIVVAGALAALPVFLLATLAIIYPSYMWSYSSPVGGYVSIFEDPETNLRLMLLASATVAIPTSPIIARELVRSDASTWKTQALALFAAIAAWLPAGAGATVIAERIFSIRGLGEWLFVAALQRDLPPLLVLLTGVTFVGVALKLFTLGATKAQRADPSQVELGGWMQEPLVVAGCAIILVLALVALIAPLLSPHNPNDVNANSRYESPSLSHWFGTDKFGKDMLTRLAHGLRYTFVLSSAVVALATAAATGAWYATSRLGSRLANFLTHPLALTSGLAAIPWLVTFLTVHDIDHAERNLFIALAVGSFAMITWRLMVTEEPPRSRNDVQRLLPSLARILSQVLCAVLLLLVTIQFLGLDFGERGEPRLGTDLAQGVRDGIEYPHLIWIPAAVLGLTLFALTLISFAPRGLPAVQGLHRLDTR